MAGAAHAAGAASIAARGISVTKEIIIATGLGLAAGGIFKARALPRPRRSSGRVAGLLRRVGFAVPFCSSLDRAAGAGAHSAAARWQACCTRDTSTSAWPRLWGSVKEQNQPRSLSRAPWLLLTDATAGLALELAAEGGAALRGLGQGKVILLCGLQEGLSCRKQQIHCALRPGAAACAWVRSLGAAVAELVGGRAPLPTPLPRY